MKNRLQNRAAGAGIVWGLDIGMQNASVCVKPGFAWDCCGRDLIVTSPYLVDAAALLRDPAAAAMLTQGSDRASARFLWNQILAADQPWLQRRAEHALRQLDALDEIDRLDAIIAGVPRPAGQPSRMRIAASRSGRARRRASPSETLATKKRRAPSA